MEQEEKELEEFLKLYEDLSDEYSDEYYAEYFEDSCSFTDIMREVMTKSLNPLSDDYNDSCRVISLLPDFCGQDLSCWFTLRDVNNFIHLARTNSMSSFDIYLAEIIEEYLGLWYEADCRQEIARIPYFDYLAGITFAIRNVINDDSMKVS